MNKNLLMHMKQFLINKLALLIGQEVELSELPYILIEKQNEIGWCFTKEEAFNGLRENLEEYAKFVSWHRREFDEVIYFEFDPKLESYNIINVYSIFMISLAEELTQIALYTLKQEYDVYDDYVVVDSAFVNSFKRQLEKINNIDEVF